MQSYAFLPNPPPDSYIALVTHLPPFCLPTTTSGDITHHPSGALPRCFIAFDTPSNTFSSTRPIFQEFAYLRLLALFGPDQSCAALRRVVGCLYRVERQSCVVPGGAALRPCAFLVPQPSWPGQKPIPQAPPLPCSPQVPPGETTYISLLLQFYFIPIKCSRTYWRNCSSLV